MELTTKLTLEQIQDADNINSLLTEEDSKVIGHQVCRTFDVDKQSRSDWEEKMQDAQDLALQVVQEKSSPWPNAANVKFPLLTIASLQFASRAYPALVKAPDLVKYRVQGQDDGQKSSRALRVSSHMSYQLLEEDEQWEEGQDKAFLALPILGCVFKKSYYDPVKGHNCSKLVLPKSLVVNYYAKSLEECESKTEIIELYPREIRERELRGLYTEHKYGPSPVLGPKEEDDRQGTAEPIDYNERPREFLEQHCFLDLDGDGYKEPYVVTVDRATKKVARIVARIEKVTTEQSVQIEELTTRIKALAEGVQPPGEGVTQEQLAQASRVEQTIMGMRAEIEELAAQKPKVLRIKPVEYYTKYSFIPSPDGGFYDLGFGALLGPLNNSVNTLINQLIDSGTLQNGSLGFIGKGARIKGGKVRFSPNEWKRVSVAGSTLRDSLVPLPVNQPSNVLFQLLSLLISYSERVGSVTDAMMGENPGQNTPAYNMSAMLEQGLQVFNGIFKRVYRSFRSEIRKLYRLNAIYLDKESYFAYQDNDSKILQVDYTGDEKDLIPAADPNAFSNKEKLMKAQAIAERAQMVPGYDPIRIEKRLLESLDIPDVDEVFPLQQNPETGAVEYVYPPQPDPEFEIKRAEEERRTLESKTRSEVTMVEAEAKLMVAEADVVLKIAQAQKLGDDVNTDRFELILKELQDKRKQVTELEKIDAAERTAVKRVGGESSQSGANPSN